MVLYSFVARVSNVSEDCHKTQKRVLEEDLLNPEQNSSIILQCACLHLHNCRCEAQWEEWLKCLALSWYSCKASSSSFSMVLHVQKVGSRG